MNETAREYHYLVDREGRVFHDGTEIVDPAVLRFFLLAMTRAEDGRYLVLCQGERNWFHVDDPALAGSPFVVQRLRLDTDEGGPRRVELVFAGDHHEPLDPRSLESEGGQLFCRARGGRFRARFGRVALQQLAPFLRDEGEGSALVVGGVRYPIRAAACVPESRPT
ncbi:MAG TPA: hypothetical protein VFE48_24055 [Methylomirabilota bacterium]|nr:hypothetical protein [Methylomirabilota bacterium]